MTEIKEYKTLTFSHISVDSFLIKGRSGIFSIQQTEDSEIQNAINNLKSNFHDIKSIVMIPEIVKPKEYGTKGTYTIIHDKTDNQAYGLHQHGNEYELSVNVFKVNK